MLQPRTRRPRNPLSALARRLGGHEWLMAWAPVIIRLEGWLRALTGNRMSLVGIAGLPSVQITVPGRRSGIARTTALLAVPLGDGYIVTGSNWGRPKTPAWAWNLGAVDEADVKVGARVHRMRVQAVTGADRPQFWADIVHYWPGYEMERRLAAGRRFPMFLLTPAGPSAADGARAGRARRRAGGERRRARPWGPTLSRGWCSAASSGTCCRGPCCPAPGRCCRCPTARAPCCCPR